MCISEILETLYFRHICICFILPQKSYFTLSWDQQRLDSVNRSAFTFHCVCRGLKWNTFFFHTVGLLNTQLHVHSYLLLLYLLFQPKGNSDIITHMARLVDTITVCITSCFHVIKGIHRIINRALRRKARKYYKFSRPGKIFMGITSLDSWINHQLIQTLQKFWFSLKQHQLAVLSFFSSLSTITY